VARQYYEAARLQGYKAVEVMTFTLGIEEVIVSDGILD
jgi:hypothetical protein